MKIDDTAFGSITIDKTLYQHDVLIRQSGQVEERQKRLSREQYGTSHLLSLEEAQFIYENNGKLLIIGTGQSGNLKLSPSAEVFFAQHDIKVVTEPTPRAIVVFNEMPDPKIGLFHVTN